MVKFFFFSKGADRYDAMPNIFFSDARVLLAVGCCLSSTMLSIAASGEPKPFQRRAAEHEIGLRVSNQVTTLLIVRISNRSLEVTGDSFLSRYLTLFSDC
jgi:hypothetical protein